jgi:SAM-dependent methyltransferase
MAHEVWAVGDAYESYVGRWSRLVARPFLDWLDVPAHQRWLDVGCGTGALTQTVLATAEPAQVVGVDPSRGFLKTAGPGAVAGDARALPFGAGRFDAVVSGLALNFVPDPPTAVTEMARVTRRLAAAYVWDYADGMAMMRHFLDAAVTLDPAAAALDEGRRFSLCQPDALRELWTAAGLSAVETRAVEITTEFADFDDHWQPFLGGQGSAPTYVASLTPVHRDELRELLRSRLPLDPGGPLTLSARAWAVRGEA